MTATFRIMEEIYYGWIQKTWKTYAAEKSITQKSGHEPLYHGHIITTEARAKEIQKIAEGLIALAVKEKDNFETVTVKAKTPRKDTDGKRVKNKGWKTCDCL